MDGFLADSGVSALSPADQTANDRRLSMVVASAMRRPPQVEAGELQQRPDGLYVPSRLADGAVQPIDLVATYATAADILGVEPGTRWIMDTLEQIALSEALAFCAYWLGRIQSPDATQRDIDSTFIEATLKDAAHARAHAAVERGVAIVLPQALLVLAKIALFRCGRAAHSQSAVKMLPAILLATASGLNEAVDRDEASMAAEMIANQNFNSPQSIHTLMALHEGRWCEPRQDGAPPLSSEFERNLNVSHDEFLAICLSVWAQAIRGNAFLSRSSFDHLTMDASRIETALGLISAPPTLLRSEIEKIEKTSPWNAVPWNFSPFERYPLVTLNEGWVVLSPRFVLQRVLTWLPSYDIRSALESREGASEAARFETALRMATENYARKAIAATLPSPARIFDETALREHLGASHKVADAAIDYGHSWIVLEISSRKIQQDTARGGGATSLEHELDILCQKARQVDSTIKQIRARDGRLIRGSRAVSTRYFPVLVMTEGYPVNPIVLSRLRELLAIRHLLSGKDTAPIEVLDLTDLHLIESIAQSGGSMIGVLKDKDASSLRNMAVRDYLLHATSVEAGQPGRVQDAVDRMFDRALRFFDGYPSGSDEESSVDRAPSTH